MLMVDLVVPTSAIFDAQVTGAPLAIAANRIFTGVCALAPAATDNTAITARV